MSHISFYMAFLMSGNFTFIYFCLVVLNVEFVNLLLLLCFFYVLIVGIKYALYILDKYIFSLAF